MKTSTRAVELLKTFEGYRNKAYKCAAGVWTIGYGTTSADTPVTGVKVTSTTTCTEAKADKWLRDTLAAKYEPRVAKYNKTYHWNQNEFDALVLFAYNLGNIDRLTADGTRSRAEIANKWRAYNRAGGKVLEGLTRRREKELKLFLTPVKRSKTAFDSFEGSKTVFDSFEGSKTVFDSFEGSKTVFDSCEESKTVFDSCEESKTVFDSCEVSGND